MAVPSSGELKLWDDLWNQELDGSKGNNSLHSASIYAGKSTPDALSDFYGYSDVEKPSVTVNAATSVTDTGAIIKGEVTATGNEDPTVGFYFGTSNTSTSNPKFTLPGTQGVGIYCCSKPVSGQTSYKSWAFACNSAGECISNTCATFTTPAPPYTPTCTNWYCCSQYQNDAPGPKSQQAAGYALNPYTNSYQAIWTIGSTTGGNAFTNNSCKADEASCNKFCHTGTLVSYWQVNTDAKVKAYNPSALWNTIFTGRGNPGLPAPSTCKFYRYGSGNAGNVYASDNSTTIELGGRKLYPGASNSPASDTFCGHLCFPSAF